MKQFFALAALMSAFAFSAHAADGSAAGVLDVTTLKGEYRTLILEQKDTPPVYVQVSCDKAENCLMELYAITDTEGRASLAKLEATGVRPVKNKEDLEQRLNRVLSHPEDANALSPSAGRSLAKLMATKDGKAAEVHLKDCASLDVGGQVELALCSPQDAKLRKDTLIAFMKQGVDCPIDGCGYDVFALQKTKPAKH